MNAQARRFAGFSLIELLLVLVVVSVLLGVMLPSSQSNRTEQLRSTSRILASDLAFARSLAVANNSSYRVSFNFTANRYTLEYSGTNASLQKLPSSPFASPIDTPNQHIVSLSDLPDIGGASQLLAAVTGASQSATNVEFGPLGQTTSSAATTIWLSAGSGSEARYISVLVDAVTGLADIGPVTATAPSQALLGSLK